MKYLFYFMCTFFFVCSGVKLPLHNDDDQVDISSNNLSFDTSGSTPHLTNTTPKRKIFNSLRSMITKKKRSVRNVFKMIGSSSKGAYTYSKHIIKKAPLSIRSYASTLPAALKSKLRLLKQKMSRWLLIGRHKNSSIDNLTEAESVIEEDDLRSMQQSSSLAAFHMDCTEKQTTQINSILQSLENMSTSDNNTAGSIYERSLASGWVLNAELIQRFVMAAGWKPLYHGRSIEEAVLHGMHVRTQYHMKDIRQALPMALSPHRSRDATEKSADDGVETLKSTSRLYLPLAVVESGASHCNRADQYGRPIVYLQLGKLEAGENIHENGSREIPDYTDKDYLFSMLHTLERAEKMIQSHFSINDPGRKLSCQKMKDRNTSNYTAEEFREAHLEEGKFVAIIDVTNVTIFSKRPSLSVVSNAVELIKYSYPNRLAALYIVNAGYIFSMIWRWIQPTLSETSIGKIFFIPSLVEARIVLPRELGTEGLERVYGGAVEDSYDRKYYFQI